MSLPHCALDLNTLAPAVYGLVGPEAKPAARRMVAQGLAPLPPDQIAIGLYQIWVDDLDDLASTAAKTIESMPESAIMSMLDSKDLPPVVIDFIARRNTSRDAIIERILDHGAVEDTTFAAVASVCSEMICQRIAENQTRWSRSPEIIASLYENQHCRQSVIHRVLEFAVRANIDVPLPMMEEIRKALVGSQAKPERDQVILDTMGDDQEVQRRRQQMAEAGKDGADLNEVQSRAFEAVAPLSKDDLQAEAERKHARHAELKTMSAMEKIRAALLGSAADRAVLVRDTNKTVAMAAIKCPRVRDNEVVAFSSDRSLSIDVIRYIANRREWVKLYAVKFNLVMNPKTPMTRSMALLSMLSRKDLVKVARSKNIPSTLQKAAKRKTQSAA